MEEIKLSAQEAEACLTFINEFLPNIDDHPEVRGLLGTDYQKALEDFRSFMTMSVAAKLDPVTIPPHHLRMYAAAHDTMKHATKLMLEDVMSGVQIMTISSPTELEEVILMITSNNGGPGTIN